MKVSVCFGATRILVPCGNGDLLVKDLITDAIRRFKKASGKVSSRHTGLQRDCVQSLYSLTETKELPSDRKAFYAYIKDPDVLIPVHHFQTQSGILDPDDRIRDVVDDREYIQACFADTTELNLRLGQSGGDGASQSSSFGHGSPDIFNSISADACNVTPSSTLDPSTMPHIEVTNISSCPLSGCGLQVRRSSDPSILAACRAEGNKRWSAAAPQCGNGLPERTNQAGENFNSGGVCLTPQWEEETDDHSRLSAVNEQQQQETQDCGGSQQPFVRSGRYSMQFLGDGNGFQWMEAAEKLREQQQLEEKETTTTTATTTPTTKEIQHSKGPTLFKRNPDCAYRPNRSLPHEHKRKEPLGQAYESVREKDIKMLLIVKDVNSPLGLTAITDKEYPGALLVQHVEPNSRADYGHLQKGDRILEINSTKLTGLSENEVQKCLKNALDGTEIRVKVKRQSPKVHRIESDFRTLEMVNVKEQKATAEESKVATVSPTYKHHASLPSGTSLQIANTRKLGRKLKINLKKGPNGLGFSVTTRDNPAGGYCPIYIKNILSRGAAIEDGHLRPGDRLLEINGLSVTGKTQSDVVAILRGTDAGSNVTLLVSRPHELMNPEQEQDVDEKTDNTGGNTEVCSAVPQIPKFQTQYTNQMPPNSQLNLVQNNGNGSQHFIDAGSESTASTDSLQAGLTWPSRERIVLHIPVHDTEKAGLGVSVKGKTSSNVSSSSNSNLKYDGDLGIFVKNVIHGGAASRDGRLRMNDQLICVNGVSLLGKSNSEAMQTLKHAIVNNPGEHPGMITIEVLRKATRSAGCSSGEVVDSSSHKENNFNVSENNGKTVIYLGMDQNQPERIENNNAVLNDTDRWNNPILDRLIGATSSLNPTQNNSYSSGAMDATETMRSNNYGLRNESYCLATAPYKDLASPALQQISLGGIKHNLHSTSPTTFLRGNSTSNKHHSNLKSNHNNNNVLIEDESIDSKSTFLFSNHSTNNTTGRVAGLDSSSNVAIGQNFDATYSSQLSIETNNSSAGVEHFSRDALGRRSMSEKHHAALDAKETGTYQRNKKLREDRERERRLKLTKSLIFGGSVESLTAQLNVANINVPDYDKRDNEAISIDVTGNYLLAQPQQSTQNNFKQQKMQMGAKANTMSVGGNEVVGPYLGLKKSSSLESLQTMVQELQMSNERDVAMTLRSSRGSTRYPDYPDSVVNQQERQQHSENVAGGNIDTRARKHWLLEDFDCNNGGFEVQRNCLLQSSMNEGKMKMRAKKSNGILRGIGSMFRFGKARKDVVMPLEMQQQQPKPIALPTYMGYNNMQTVKPSDPPNKQVPTRPTASEYSQQSNTLKDNVLLQGTTETVNQNAVESAACKTIVPNIEQQPSNLHRIGNEGIEMARSGGGGNNLIHQNDVFNQRYPLYRNYEQLCNPHKSTSKIQRHTYRSKRNQRSLHSVQQRQHLSHNVMPNNSSEQEQRERIDGNVVDYGPSYLYNSAVQQHDRNLDFTYRHDNLLYRSAGSSRVKGGLKGGSSCLITPPSNYPRNSNHHGRRSESTPTIQKTARGSLPSQHNSFETYASVQRTNGGIVTTATGGGRRHQQHHMLLNDSSSGVSTKENV